MAENLSAMLEGEFTGPLAGIQVGVTHTHMASVFPPFLNYIPEELFHLPPRKKRGPRQDLSLLMYSLS